MPSSPPLWARPSGPARRSPRSSRIGPRCSAGSNRASTPWRSTRHSAANTATAAVIPPCTDMVMAIGATRAPEATVPLYFAPAEAAQVDFGAGPLMHDPAVLRVRRTWCFVMTLCFSRHQYVEFVWDQTVATWLG